MSFVIRVVVSGCIGCYARKRATPRRAPHVHVDLLLAVFSTHAINIYAGVNGLECGQSVVIGLGVLLINVLQLARTADASPQWATYRSHHAQSLFIIVPFLATSFALLRANWWPAKVFVGDTYVNVYRVSF
jgi:UDP-N-acetylmuramyl pentapeptide phosphotransferase/UDP-N-acetylglucosamine-1-phosphate transferase